MGIGPSVPTPNKLPLETRLAVLAEGVTLKGFAEGIKSGRFKNVLVVAGAGLSVSAGIPDFRSPGTGLYHNLQKYGLRRAEEIFSIDFFTEEPRPFFHLAKELYPGTFKPTLAHYLLKLLDDKGVLKRVYTQNIDTLERLTGISPDKVIEAHGSFATATCRTCGAQYSQEWMAAKLFGEGKSPLTEVSSPAPKGTPHAEDAASVATPPPEAKASPVDFDKVIVPHCDKPGCGGVVKPDITFFGESLPDRYANNVGPDSTAADALIVIGTSLKVMPVSGIPGRVSAYCPRLLINREVVNACDVSEDTARDGVDAKPAAGDGSASDDDDDDDSALNRLVASQSSGFRFFLKDNYRDVLLQGDCDDGAWAFAAELGWQDELAALCPEGAAAARRRAAAATAEVAAGK